MYSDLFEKRLRRLRTPSSRLSARNTILNVVVRLGGASSTEVATVDDVDWLSYDVDFWVAFVDDLPLSTGTKNKYIVQLREWYKALHVENVVSTDYVMRMEYYFKTTKVTGQKRKSYPLGDEVDDLRAACFSDITGQTERNILLVELMLEMGLRLAEVCRMKWIDVEGDFITVYGKWHNRTDMPIGRRVRDALDAVRDVSPYQNMNDYVLCSFKGGYCQNGLSTRGAARALELIMRGTSFTPHSLRYAAGIRAYLGGASLDEVQRLMRHKSSETTMHYLRDAGYTQKVINAMDAQELDTTQAKILEGAK